MQGDKIELKAWVIEENEMPVFAVEIGQKPQFMLQEEYNHHILECGVNVLQAIATKLYPENPAGQKKCLEYIKKKL